MNTNHTVCKGNTNTRTEFTDVVLKQIYDQKEEKLIVNFEQMNDFIARKNVIRSTHFNRHFVRLLSSHATDYTHVYMI